MKQIVLDCRGRLGNQLVSYAVARSVLQSMGLEREIIIKYPIPHGRLRFLGATVDNEFKTDNLPSVTRETLDMDGDCLWVWEDLYDNNKFPKGDVLEGHIRSIMVSDEFNMMLNSTCFDWSNVVGVHVRCGDYFTPSEEHPVGSTFARTPHYFYLNSMNVCRAIDSSCRFFLASDGTDVELEPITSRFDVIRGNPEDDVFDLWALSRCRIVVGSDSTFTVCAGIIGNKKTVIYTT